SFDYTVTASDLTRSGNIGILLYSFGTGGASTAANQSFFDNVRLSVTSPPLDDFDAYISNPSFGIDPGDRDFNDDPDGDSLANGLESWFGTHPGEFNAGIVNLATDGTVTTFTHPENETLPADVSGYYQWSLNLIDWYEGAESPLGGPEVIFSMNTVGTTTTVTATAGAATDRLFLRIVVALD
ncbi:hypothetical protein, partial [Haloferula sp.]|uniref:hypothetical protein n=1 Tax=Haloferula sp. TaxID=2497595 RepID=UPI003C72DB7D